MIRRKGDDRKVALAHINRFWQDEVEEALKSWKVRTDKIIAAIHKATTELDKSIRSNQYRGKGNLKSYFFRLCKKKVIPHVSQEQLLRMICNKEMDREFVFYLMEKKWKKSAERFLLSKGGKPDDIENIIQDAIEVLLNSVCKKSFQLTSTLEAYFLGICFNIYRSGNRRQNRTSLFSDHYKLDKIEHNTPESSLLSAERKKVIHEALQKLEPICREVLLLNANSYSHKEIVTKLGFKNTGIVAGWLFRGRRRLRKIIGEDPLFNNFHNDKDE